MSYIDKNLLDDEKVIYRAHIHWVILLGPLFWYLLIFFIYYAIDYFGFYSLMPYRIWLLIPLLLAIVDGIGKFITYVTTEFGVTNRRVIVKKGFIHYYSFENFLQKVEDIRVSQTILGRILEYGTIIIIGTGGTAEKFDFIADPLIFRKQVQEQVEKALQETRSQ